MKLLLGVVCAVTLLTDVQDGHGTERANPNVSLVRVPNGGIQPQVVTDRDGTLHLLYYSGDPAGGNLYYVRSSDAGRSWSRAVRVNAEDGTAVAKGTIRGGQLAIGKNGRVHVAWNGSSKAHKPPGAAPNKRGTQRT